jgi:hypothetical protein
MKHPFSTATPIAAAAAAALLVALTACSTVDSIRGPETGASTEAAAYNVRPNDPLARPTQVAWTSARATRCGFVFNPQQLRSNYLAYESRFGHGQARMAKTTHAYDYTLESVFQQIKNDQGYCTKDRLDAIRVDLNRHLSGDYRAIARMAR